MHTKLNFSVFAKELFFILFGSLLYALGTVLFIFPHSLLLGGTSGISVILERFLAFSPGTILMVINFSLLLAAFLILGKSMAVKTTIGTILTTVAIRLFEPLFAFEQPLITNIYLSSVLGASIIALASGILFYVDSSSGGTDIIALIVKKFSNLKIGKALLLTDILIVITGGVLSGIVLLLSSFLGLLIKTCGIDLFIAKLQKNAAEKGKNHVK